MLGRCLTTLLVRRGEAALLSTWPAGWPSTTTPSEAADSRGYAAGPGSPGAEAPQGSPRTPDHRPNGGRDRQGGPLCQMGWVPISRQQGGERHGSSWQAVLGAGGQKQGLLLQVLPATQRAVATRGAINRGQEVVGARKKRCEHVGCHTLPNFGHPGGRAQYCRAHALEGMEDVVHKRCEHVGCRTQPSYGHPGGRRQYCKPHALEHEGMVHLRVGGP